MLILMRRPSESVEITVPPGVVAVTIVVTIVSLERNRARVGFEAPLNVTVDREEIAARKRDGLPPPDRETSDDDLDDDEINGNVLVLDGERAPHESTIMQQVYAEAAAAAAPYRRPSNNGLATQKRKPYKPRRHK